jgi:hypothetical protein
MSVFDQLNKQEKKRSKGGVFNQIQQQQEKQAQNQRDNYTDLRQSMDAADQEFYQIQPKANISAKPTVSTKQTTGFSGSLGIGEIPKGSPVDNKKEIQEDLNYVFKENPVARVLNYLPAKIAEKSVPNAPMIGTREDGSYGNLPETNAREFYANKNPVQSTGFEGLDKAGDVAGHVGSYLFNPAGLGQGPLSIYQLPIVQKLAGQIGNKVMGKTGQKVLEKANPLLNQYGINISDDLAQKVAKEAAREGITGAAYATPYSLLQGQTSGEEIAQNVALDGALGVVGGAAMPVLGQGIRTALSKLFNKSKNKEAIQEILALPEPKKRGNVNIAQTPDVINVPPSPTKAKIGKAETNQYELKLNRLFEEANKLEQQGKLPAGRELEAVEDLWSRMAEYTDPSLDELIDLAYPKQRTISPNALSKGRTASAAGLGPNVKRLESISNEAIPNVEINQPKPMTKEQLEVMNMLASSPNKERVGGVFKQLEKAKSETRMRDRIVSFLDEQETAARERIKSKRNKISSNPLDIYADYAIIGAAKMGKGTVKFADWSEQMAKEFGEEVRPHLQKIYNKSKAIVRDSERKVTKESEEARVFNSKNEGDANTFRNKVNRGTKSNKVPFSKRWEKVRTQVIDDLAPLEGLEKSVRGKVASAEDSLYKSGRLFRGVPEKANRIVKDSLIPVINNIENKGYTSADLGDYALAVHARDVNAKDIKSGFTNKEIDEVINRLGTDDMEFARKQLIQISNDMLSELEKAGVISGDLVKTLKEKYPNYMPLFRNFDDDKVDYVSGLGKSLGNVTSPIKGLKGSKRQVIDPLESMVKNIFQSTSAAERNKVASQLAKLAEEDEGANFIRKLDEIERVGRKNVISVLQDGQKVRYEVEPEVYKAMMNLDKETSNMLINVLQKPASVLRAGATLTPEFSLRNPLRDVLQAFVTSESGFNPLIDFPIGVMQSISKGDLYKQWAKELGAYGNIISNDRKVHKEALESTLKQSPGKKFVNVVTGKSLINVLRSIADVSESATKVGEFRAALRKGATPQEAAYRSRDVMDFNRAGASVRQTNKIVAFLNANIQGKSKLIRAFKKDPVGFSARAFSSVTVPTIGVFIMQQYMANDVQKQIIDEAPTWMTDTFWLIPIPGTNQVARIPKPFDLSILFSNLPERALKYIFNNDKEAFDKFARKAMADMAIPGMISGLTPFIEGMANYSFFRQRNIIPMGEEYRKYSDQYDIDTTETAKAFAKGAELLTGGEGTFKNFSSPRIMDNTIRGLTAGLGTYATSAIDVLLENMNITDNPAKPKKGAEQKPLAKAFLVNPLQGGKSTEKLYDMRKKLTRERGSAELNNRPFEDEAKLKFINNRTSKMAEINNLIREIENSKKIRADKKGDAIRKLTKAKNKIAREAVEILQNNP